VKYDDTTPLDIDNMEVVSLSSSVSWVKMSVRCGGAKGNKLEHQLKLTAAAAARELDTRAPSCDTASSHKIIFFVFC
jgi:hypothetical protein